MQFFLELNARLPKIRLQRITKGSGLDFEQQNKFPNKSGGSGVYGVGS